MSHYIYVISSIIAVLKTDILLLHVSCIASANRLKFLCLIREKRMKIIKRVIPTISYIVITVKQVCTPKNRNVIVYLLKKVYVNLLFRECRDFALSVLGLFWRGNKTSCITITNNTDWTMCPERRFNYRAHWHGAWRHGPAPCGGGQHTAT